MTSSDNKRKELEHILSSGNFVRITNAIKLLREEPPFRGAIELVVAYYDKSDNSPIKGLIRDLLNDLKDKSLSKEVMAEINKELKPETLRMLVSSCWQSGLDYSDFSSDFGKLFISGDYMTALECFTVIESSVHKMPSAEKDAIVKMIKEGSMSNKSEYKYLAAQLISLLE